MYPPRVQAKTQVKSESLEPSENTIKENSRKMRWVMLVVMDMSREGWSQAKTHQVHNLNKWNKKALRWHGRAYGHGMVVPKFYPVWLALASFSVWDGVCVWSGSQTKRGSFSFGYALWWVYERLVNVWDGRRIKVMIH